MPASPARLPLLALLAALLVGCAHRARFVTDPPGATISARGQELGTSPRDVSFRWWLFNPMKVTISAPGYRTVTVKMKGDVGLFRFTGELLSLRVKRLFATVPRTTHEVVLVREHDPSGTWVPEDIKP